MPNSLRAKISKLAYKGLITRDDANRIREVLAKDIAKKPKKVISKILNFTDVEYECPSCEKIVTSMEPKISLFAGRNIYCDMCGQRLDWGEYR